MLILFACEGLAFAADGDGDKQATDTTLEPNVSQTLAAEGRGDPYADESFAKSVPLFGSGWRFSFGGYAKVDVIADFSGTGDKQQFVLATIPVDGDPPPGSYANLQAAETRFNFEIRNSNSKYSPDRFFLEMDFFDESNKTSPRLRHAYFEYGKLLAGRTWTLLTELRQLPFLLDFAAGDSILGGRTEQIRWTQANAEKDFAWSVSVENFDDEEIFNPATIDGVARADFPRVAAGMTRKWDRATISFGGALTQLRWDGSGTTSDATEAAYTATTAGRVFLDGAKSNYIGFGISYASGAVTDIITFANGLVPNAAIDANGELDIAKGWNAQLGAHWNWNPAWSSNVSLAYARLTDVPVVFDPDFIRKGSSVHANIVYTHNKRIKAGLELMHGVRENVSGNDDDAQRMQFSFIYYF